MVHGVFCNWKVIPWGEKLCGHWCGWCYSCVWWQVGVCVCQGGDWAMPAAGAWSPVVTPESQLLPVSPGQALPPPALSHNTFISRPSSSSPHHTTSVISTSPTSQRHFLEIRGVMTKQSEVFNWIWESPKTRLCLTSWSRPQKKYLKVSQAVRRR